MAFAREAFIDNNIVERSLKKAILNRRSALFYKTLHGAGVGDLFMSPIHTCELNVPIHSIIRPSCSGKPSG